MTRALAGGGGSRSHPQARRRRGIDRLRPLPIFLPATAKSSAVPC